MNQRYNESKCYCGNKFLRLKVKEFNYCCYIHDNDYDILSQYKVALTGPMSDDIISDMKLNVDKKFLKNCKDSAKQSSLEMKGNKFKRNIYLYKLLAYAYIGYYLVRSLGTDYL